MTTIFDVKMKGCSLIDATSQYRLINLSQAKSILFMKCQITTEVISGHFSYRAGLDCTLYFYRDPECPHKQALGKSIEEKPSKNQRLLCPCLTHLTPGIHFIISRISLVLSSLLQINPSINKLFAIWFTA